MAKKNNYHFIVLRGKAFYLGPLNESNEKNPVLVVSNELHNQYSDHLVVVLLTDKNVEQVRNPLEIYCEIASKKFKILVSRFFTIDKTEFFELRNYLGQIDEITMQKVSDKIKLILDLG